MSRTAVARGAIVLALAVLVTSCGEDSKSSGTPDASVDAPVTNHKITGFAASLPDWRSAHEEAPGFSPGSSYLPLIGDQPRYYAVSPAQMGDSTAGSAPDEQTIVHSYSVAMSPGTNEKAAIAEAMAEFPDDATIVRFRVGEGGTCKQFRVQSSSVQRQLVNFHWGESYPFFQLQASDGSKYSPSRVDSVIFGVGPADEFYGC